MKKNNSSLKTDRYVFYWFMISITALFLGLSGIINPLIIVPACLYLIPFFIVLIYTIIFDFFYPDDDF